MKENLKIHKRFSLLYFFHRGKVMTEEGTDAVVPLSWEQMAILTEQIFTCFYLLYAESG